MGRVVHNVLLLPFSVVGTVVHTVLFIHFSVKGTVVHTVLYIDVLIQETGGPYCPVYSFLCFGSGGSFFLYIAISVKGTFVHTFLYIPFSGLGMVVYTVLCIAIFIQETGGPYCCEHSFLCRGNGGSNSLL